MSMLPPEGSFHRAPRPLIAWATFVLVIALTVVVIVVLETAKQRVEGFRAHRDQCTGYLNAADTPRVMVEQFDPDAGWP